jgi:exodeoxyribonuclease V alpha subunit
MLRQGLAKNLFFENEKRFPWLFKEKKESPWPSLNDLLTKRIISYLDLLLVHNLLNLKTAELGPSQELALFICHLLLSAKKGHLCVKIEADKISPAIEAIWESDDEIPLSESMIKTLNQMVLDGSQNVPSSLLSKIPTENRLHKPLCVYKNLFYLQRHWVLESQLIQHLKRHLSISPEFKLDPHMIQSELSRMTQEGVLLQEQAEAILKCTHSSFALITGGPGTGKTYTAGQLIKVIWNGLSPELRTNCQIVLAAPTGKAAANLQKSLGNATSSIEGLPKLQAKTLHSLLGIKSSDSSIKSSLSTLSADIVVVDESSMIDVKMMGYLFKALKLGSRLILLGDQFQLPSVEAGSIFYDLIQVAKKSDLIPCTELKKCLRVELQSILQLAQCVNQGKAHEVLALISQNTIPGIGNLQLPEGKGQAQKAFIEMVKKVFPTFVKETFTASEILNSFNTLRILSPLRKGLFGVDELNQLILQQIYKQAPSSGWLAIPIIVVTNDYKMDLFNGETGVLMRKLPYKGASLDDYALFPARNPHEPPRRFSSLILPKFEYAYCLSVYKSQGSEFDRVILVLPEGSEIFGREMLYTAITRAKCQIDIYATSEVLKNTIQQQGTRLSGLQIRF